MSEIDPRIERAARSDIGMDTQLFGEFSPKLKQKKPPPPGKRWSGGQ
jgi:hypothetical protein